MSSEKVDEFIETVRRAVEDRCEWKGPIPQEINMMCLGLIRLPTATPLLLIDFYLKEPNPKPRATIIIEGEKAQSAMYLSTKGDSFCKFFMLYPTFAHAHVYRATMLEIGHDEESNAVLFTFE